MSGESPKSSNSGDHAAEQETEWVHAVNASQFRQGGVFGWRDKRSETGFLSGVVVEVDHLHLRVRVRDIRAGILK